MNDTPNLIFGPATRFFDFPKKSLILQPEHTEKYIYYLLKGSVVMLVESNGEEVCTGIFTEHQYFSSYASFLTKRPTPTYIKAIEDCSLAAIYYDDLQEAYQFSAAHERNGRLISEQLFIKSQQRTTDLITLSAEERYLKFLKENPIGIQRFPLKYIASLLGMTPVSLSRIRRKLAH